VILDEVQNFSPDETRLACTRIGEDCKLVLNGDLSQISHSDLDAESNGLVWAIERSKKHLWTGHISLNENCRSWVSGLFS